MNQNKPGCSCVEYSDKSVHIAIIVGLVEESNDKLTVVDLERGISLLDQRCDNYFGSKN